MHESIQWKIAKALIVALGVRRCFSLAPQIIDRIVPLIDMGEARLYLVEASALIGVTILLAHAFGRFQRSFFLILCSINALLWFLLYSAAGAFSLHPAVMCLLGFVCSNLPIEKIKEIGRWTFISIFIAAASFKLNSFYLSGVEFQPHSDFMWSFYQYDVARPYVIGDSLAVTLSIISVLVEAGIAVLALFNFAIATHVAMLFLLIMTPVNKYVFSVYPALLPFLFIADEKFTQKIGEFKIARWLTSSLVWLASIIGVSLVVRRAGYPYEIAALAIALFVFHAIWLLRDLKPFKIARTADSSIFPRVVIVPAIIIVLVVAKRLGAPSPTGYSMFAGIRDQSPVHLIKIQDTNICGRMTQLFEMTVAVDAGVAFSAEGCRVRFATASGMDYIKRTLCANQPALRWDYLPRGNKEWTGENCTNYR